MDVVLNSMSETNEYKDPREEELEESLTNYRLESLDLCYDEAKATLQMQVRNVENLTARIVSLLGTNGLLFAVLIAVWSVFRNSSVPRSILFGLAGCFVAFSALWCVGAQLVRNLKGAPDPELLVKKYITWEPRNAKYKHLPAVLKAIKHNEEVLNKMSKRLKVAMYLVALALFSLLSMLVVLFLA